MRIKLGAILQDARGQLGDQTIFSSWKSNVHYIRQAATAVHNPNSSKQGEARNEISANSKNFRDLTPAQITAWNAYAKNGFGGGAGIDEGSSLDIIKRNGGTYSGINAYVMTNGKLDKAGLTTVDDAPIGVVPPSAPKALTGSPSALIVTWTLPEAVKTGAKVIIWAKPKFGSEFHEQVVGTALATALTYTITAITGPDGGEMLSTLPPGYKILVQAMTVDPDGTFSGPGNVVEVAVPAA